MSFDAVSYVLGHENGEGRVVLREGENYTFTDADSDGNVEIAKEESDG